MSGLSPPGPWYDVFCRNPELLQRCRSLESFALTSLGQGSFNWAVQEKKNATGSSSCNETTTTTTTATVLENPSHGQGAAAQPNRADHGLAPLSEIRLLESPVAPFTEEIDDIITAFGQTLQRVYIGALDPHPPRPFPVGQG